MKQTLVLLGVILALIPQTLQAQWRIGADAGASYNLYSIDKQYMTDYIYAGAWGASAGVIVQYDIRDWVGIRTGLNFTQRNYRHTRAVYADHLDCLYQNDYLLVPLAARFSFGGAKVRGFSTLGVYSGYWLSSSRSGKEYAPVGATAYEFDSQPVAFNSEKDRRFDFGYTGSIGIEWRFAAHWAAQAEAVGYYSVVSSVKQYMEHVKDYRYNTTGCIRLGMTYIF